MAIETVYKVVHCRGGKLFSVQMSTHGWEVRYQTGIVVEPLVEGSLLFAFSELNPAVFWRNRHAKLQIWEAEAEDPIPFQRVSSFALADSITKRFWSHLNRGTLDSPEEWVPWVKAPKGTVACKSIRLIRLIEKEELERTA